MLAFLILKLILKMHTYKLLFTFSVLIFIWIIIFIGQTNFIFTFIIIAIINRFFFHIVFIILENNIIRTEGAKAVAEALKLNNSLTHLHLCKFLQLFT